MMMCRVFRLGSKGNLEAARQRARVVASEIQQMSPRMSALFEIAGYDGDERDLWDIPEARDFLIVFSDELFRCGVDESRLLPQMRLMIKACHIASAGHVIEVAGSEEDGIRATVAQVVRNFHDKGREVH